MTPEERRAQLRRILDHHEGTLRQLRAADGNCDALQAATREVAVTCGELAVAAAEMLEDARQQRLAIHAAIDAALAANRAALGLHNEGQ